MSASSTSAPSPAATDAAFLSLLHSFQSSGLGGELRFVDSFFSFLRRHTPLLRSASAVEQLQAMAMKHVELAKKEAKEEKEAKAKQEEEERKKKESEAAAAAASTASAPAAATAAASSSSSTTDLKDEPEDEEDSLPPPEGNGGTTDKYSWTQSLAEVNVSIPLPAGTGAKQLQVEIDTDRLHASLKVGDKTVFLSGEPDEPIDSSDATWTLESSGSGKTLELYLPKRNKMSWWSCVVKGDPKINTKKIVPENSKLEDLDSDTRSTVEKMMFDQRQKQAGRPTSDEMQKQQALKRFMEMHPEMDFSQAKFS